MADGAFPRDKHLTSIVIGYRNPDASYIADSVLPRVPVGKKTFKWLSYPLAESFVIPDTRVGEKGRFPIVEISGTEESDSCEDHGVSLVVSNDEISQAQAGTDPIGRAAAQAANLMKLGWERLVANMVFDEARYAAANKVDLDDNAGEHRFSATANDFDPIKFISGKLDACLIRPNVFVCGAEVWNALSFHPKVVSASLGNSGTAGRASRERVAELLEVSEVLVGQTWVNTTKRGKATSLARAWGKHALAFYRDRTADTSGGLTFGFTAEFDQQFGGAKDVDVGVRGGKEVRAAQTVKACLVAPSAAFYFENAVA